MLSHLPHDVQSCITGVQAVPFAIAGFWSRPKLSLSFVDDVLLASRSLIDLLRSFKQQDTKVEKWNEECRNLRSLWEKRV